ncbi:MAG: serine hydrolase domain-containing protein, partial [Ilumatobacteraceae bacterium]
YDWADESLARFVPMLPPAQSGSQAAYEHPLVADPGEQWAYGIGIDWAGRVVEAASGQRLDAYFRDRIFTPLGMVDTTFSVPAAQRGRMATIHRRSADGGLRPMPFAMDEEPEMFMAGGGLYSTARDYLRFTRMLLHRGTLDGARVLAPETVATMLRNDIGTIRAHGWTSFNPVLSNDVDLFPGHIGGWGLTFLVNPHVTPEGRSPGSAAWAGLANTYYWIDPTAGVTGVFLTQVLPFFDETSLGTFHAFERAVYTALAAGRLTPVAPPRSSG